MNKVSTIAAITFVMLATCPLTLLAQADVDGGSEGAVAQPKKSPPKSRAGKPHHYVEDESAAHRQKPAFSRPEGRGEDLSKLETRDVIQRLATGKDKGELRKCAKVLGDRAIAGPLNLDDAEKQSLEKYIASQILRTAAAQGDERQEAIAQLQRLWRLSVPQLFDDLGHANPTIREAAIKSLCIMRNESIVKELIARVEASKDVNFRQAGVFALGMMREQRNPMVPDRTVLDDDASKELADRLIVPFLDRIEATDADPEMRQIVANAREFLNKPLDSSGKRGHP